MSAQPPSTTLLMHFSPLNKLSEKQLILLADKVEIKHFVEGQCVVELNSEDHLEYFLVSGAVKLESFDGRVKEVDAQSDTAKTAIALLQPRRYRVSALKDCKFIIIQQKIVKALLDELPKDKNIEFSAADVHSGHEIQDIEASFMDDLKTNNIELRSFPDVALQIKALLEDPDVSVRDIAKAMTNDPAITVKLIKTCNSALYRSATEITSCQDAIVRLGFATTRRLVNIFAMKELFKSKNQALQAKMSRLWSDSREVATIAYVLAEITPRMNPELAMLAGLVQNVGAIPIIEHLDRYPQFMKIEHKVDEAIDKLKTKIGPQLLENWGFQEDLVKVAANSENWRYKSPGSAADYVDLIVAAQVHALIGKSEHHNLPNFSEIPAFKKLGESGLTPEQSQQVLLKSHKKIAELKALLSMSDIPVLK
jgi:HD-like signal output (HDOD) protein